MTLISDRLAILSALEYFDLYLRTTTPYAGWNLVSDYHAIVHQGKQYPVQPIATAARQTLSQVDDTAITLESSIDYVRASGFEIVQFHKRNPKWTRDELILALDFYLDHRPTPPGKESAEIAELSSTLNQMAMRLGVTRNSTYRNPNGVYMKLMNFRRLDPAFADQGKVGLSRGGKDEEEVWNLFSSAPQRCHDIAQAIRSALADDSESTLEAFDIHLDEDFEDAPEGRVLTVTHQRRERKRALVDSKKAFALKKFGKLECEACGFDFHDFYGPRGSGIIECHHTKPLESLAQDGGRTALRDLALLCANCHRVVHAKRPWLTIEELRALLNKHSPGL